MDVVGTVAAFVAILVVLVLVHELGHFITAKLAGITVEEFGIGFPPRITSMMFRGTRYSLNWIPLGGFVRMLGEDGDVEIRRLRESGLDDAQVEQAMAGAFNRKPILVRIGVLVAGVAMNFVLAIGLFAWAAALPQPFSAGPLRVISIQEGSPADGTLEPGDVIVAADGRSFERSLALTEYVADRGGQPVTLTIDRDGQEMTITVTPRDLTPQDIEAAVYFSALEALQNVAKYAGASRAVVRVAQTNGALTFAVEDDGSGFDPALTGYGTGLQGMADRLEAIGGSLDVRSAPGEGTRVLGRVPTRSGGAP